MIDLSHKLVLSTMTKIVLLGNSGVGKTKWLYHQKNSPFLRFEPTRGVEVRKVDDYTFWDTGGDARFI